MIASYDGEVEMRGLLLRGMLLGLWAGCTPGIGQARGDDAAPNTRLRVIVETDAGGDPDDEQSLVRFLLHANEWDVEGIVANRSAARDGENRNRERTGLGAMRWVIICVLPLPAPARMSSGPRSWSTAAC
jgi:hypothetical protein